jgi:Fur family transcriptional regulator, ferric uptake regulator
MEMYEIVHADHHHHEHMKCEKCNKIISFESEEICKKIFEEAKKLGFSIKEHSVVVRGLCKNCSLLKC